MNRPGAPVARRPFLLPAVYGSPACEFTSDSSAFVFNNHLLSSDPNNPADLPPEAIRWSKIMHTWILSLVLGLALIPATVRAENAACSSCRSNVAATATAPTLDQRVRVVEGKTNYFLVKRITKSRIWGNLKIQAGKVVSSQAGDVVPLDQGAFYQYVQIGGTEPVIASAWLHIVGQYTANGEFQLSLAARQVLPGALGSPNDYCNFEWTLPAASGTFDKKVFCQGAVNPQEGQVFGVQIGFGGNGTIQNVTLTSHLVNQVITEPSE
jgi:hypothetical protein